MSSQPIVPVRDGGTLVFASQQDIASFNVNTSGGSTFTDQMVMDRVWPQTFLVDPQFKPVLDPAFLQSAELVSTNPQTIVYKLNPKAVWSDGVPIDASDFIYNWRVQSGQGGTDVNGQPYEVASTAGYSSIESVTGSNGGKTVTVVFKQPYSDWESLFDNLVPAHIAERAGWNTAFNSFNPANVISGGPFMVTSYVPGSELVLSRNPHYWGTPAHLDHIVFRLVPDASQTPVALRNQQVGLIYPRPEPAIVTAAKHIIGVDYRLNLGLSYESVNFNEANPFLADVTVRKAIALAIDRTALAKATVGQMVKHVQPLGNRIFVTNQSGYRDNGPTYQKPGVAAARSMLEGDGYSPGPSGYLTKAGRVLELTLQTTSGDPLRVQTAQLIAADLRAAGVKARTLDVSGLALAQNLAKGNFDMALYSSTGSPFPSSAAARYETRDPATGSGSRNWTGFSDPQVDKLFAQASEQLNPTRADADYNQIDTILWSRMVTLPLFQDPTLIAYSSRYANIADNPSSSGPFWDAELWGLRLTKS